MGYPTVHDKAVSRFLIKNIKDPQWAALIGEFYVNLHDGYYKHEKYVFQNHIGDISVEDATAFMLVHGHIFSDNFLVASVYVGSEPGYDSDVDGNNKKLGVLKEWYPGLFDAEFSPETGSGANSDGWFKFTDIEMDCLGTENKAVKHYGVTGKLPLEVGTTKASRTLVHFLEDRGVARWPYGSDTIMIYYAPNGIPAKNDFPWERRYAQNKRAKMAQK